MVVALPKWIRLGPYRTETVELEGGEVCFEPHWALLAAAIADVVEPVEGEPHFWQLRPQKTDSDYDLVTGFLSWRS